MSSSLNPRGISIDMKKGLKIALYSLIIGAASTVIGLGAYQAIRGPGTTTTPTEVVYQTPTVEVVTYQTPTAEPTPTVVPTPQPTATVVPTIVPTRVPTPTPTPTPVLTEYQKFQSTLDIGELGSYFTEEFFNDIGKQKSDALVSYINNSLNSELSNLSSERVKEINGILPRGPPYSFNDSFGIMRWNEYFENELSQKIVKYGHSEDELRTFMDYVNENGVDVNVKDIGLYGDTVIAFNEKNVLENYGYEIERLVNHARDTEVAIYLDNKLLSNFYSVIAEGAEWNREFLISQGSEERHRHYNLPEHVFTRSWFGYNSEIFKGSAENYGIGSTQALKLNVSRADFLQKHIQKVLSNQEDFSIDNGPFDQRNDYEKAGLSFLEITKDNWIKTQETKKYLYDLYENSPEFNQIMKITTLTHLSENRTHSDVASKLTDIYGTLLGLEVPDLYTGYPYGHVTYGGRTESNAVRLTPEIREVFSDIANSNDFIHDEWISIPWWSDSVTRSGLTPYIYINLYQDAIYIWNIDRSEEEYIENTFFIHDRYREPLYDYIEEHVNR